MFVVDYFWVKKNVKYFGICYFKDFILIYFANSYLLICDNHHIQWLEVFD